MHLIYFAVLLARVEALHMQAKPKAKVKASKEAPSGTGAFLALCVGSALAAGAVGYYFYAGPGIPVYGVGGVGALLVVVGVVLYSLGGATAKPGKTAEPEQTVAERVEAANAAAAASAECTQNTDDCKAKHKKAEELLKEEEEADDLSEEEKAALAEKRKAAKAAAKRQEEEQAKEEKEAKKKVAAEAKIAGDAELTRAVEAQAKAETNMQCGEASDCLAKFKAAAEKFKEATISANNAANKFKKVRI